MARIILEKFYENVRNEPNKLCLADGKHEMSYLEAWSVINRGCSLLRNKGMKNGDRLCMVGEQTVPFLLLLSSAHLLGVTVVPIEKGITERRLKEIADLMDTRWIAGPDKITGLVQITYQEFEENCINNKEEPHCTIEFDNLFVNTPQDILFTTGTTGTPKGIMLSATAVKAVAENIISSVSMNKNEIELITCPLFHSMGLRRYYSGIMNGSTVVLSVGNAFLDDVPKLLNLYNVTAMTMVPSQVALLIRFHSDTLVEHKKMIRYIQVGTTYMRKDVVNKLLQLLPDVYLYNVYGMSEAGCTNCRRINEDHDDITCVGKTMPNAKIWFEIDGKIKERTTIERPGIIYVSGSVLMDGYWKDSQKTNEVLINGMLRTEDIGYCDDDGNVYVLGRKSDVINSGGNKISPTEIESVAVRCPGVDECACVPMPDRFAGQLPKLFVVSKDKTLTSEALRRFIEDRIERFKVPKQIEFVSQLPKAANGKVLKNKLLEKVE